MSGKEEIGGPDRPLWILDQGLIALAFMTRLPVPHRDGSIAASGWAFPLAGAVVGALSGAVLWLATAVGLPPVIAAILAAAAGTLVTGALHEDGLADCCDGFWARATPARRLEIMRDSRSGVFGVLGLMLATGLKVSTIALLAGCRGAQPVWAMLIAVHAVARAPLPGAMTILPMAGKTGLAAMAGKPGGLVSAAALVLAAGLSGAALDAMPVWMPAGLIGASVVAAVAVGLLSRVKLRGINGDSLGCMEQLAEIFCLLLLISAEP